MVKTEKFTYRLFGLIVNSEIEFPELLEAQGEADVHIRLFDLSRNSTCEGGSESSWSADSESFFLNIKDTGKYLVRQGRVIEVEPAASVQPGNLRVFILGTCMGVLLHQRGVLPIHASGISTKHGCVMFSGVSGIGKSTLAMAFHKRGYNIVTDDICAISLDKKGKAVVSPAYPQVKIKSESASLIGISTQGLLPVSADLDKFRLPVKEDFQHVEIPIHKIYFLGESELPKTVFRQMHGKEKLISLLENTYRRELLGKLAQTEGHFQVCQSVGRQLTAMSLVRQRNTALFNSLINDIENDFR